jgi:DNA invertase Pin-like site-specific DNA recombinase
MLPGERGDGKIRGWHRDRLAVIYVRQSSRQQVLDHGESTRLQYGLTGRASALGWAASRVMVIDEDLGRSAANAAERPGFARLVAEITMGHVGLVLGLEMSRLARAGRDWHQLIELCSLAGALLADADGVYDPNWYNDRLLLGLKGTMSEGRAASDQAADGFGAAGQGRPRGAGCPAAGRVCPAALRRGCPGSR